ncbi:MAG: hypothetical protein RL263_860 [Bacteroidota bacterium]|jgi:hypothetical protein
MKKTISLLSFALLFVGLSYGQLVVDALTFAQNPSVYNGRTIIIRNIQCQLANTVATPQAVLPPAGNVGVGNAQTVTAPSVNTQGRTATGTVPSQQTRCLAPRSWVKMDVFFPPKNESKFCFVIYDKMANVIPANREVNADLTIKVDTRAIHRVTRIKINP